MISFQPIQVDKMHLIGAVIKCDCCGTSETVVMTMVKRGRQVQFEVYEKPQGWLASITDAMCHDCLQKDAEKNRQERRNDIVEAGDNFHTMSHDERLAFLKSLPGDYKPTIYQRLRDAISQLKSIKQENVVQAAAE